MITINYRIILRVLCLEYSYCISSLFYYLLNLIFEVYHDSIRITNLYYLILDLIILHLVSYPSLLMIFYYTKLRLLLTYHN